MNEQGPEPVLVRKGTTFRGDVSRLVTGTGVAQLISILAAPIVARMYAPEVFGVAALFAALVLILGVAACLRYELAIVLPPTDRESANLLAASLCIAILVSALIALLLAIFGTAAVSALGATAVIPYLWLVPIAVFVHGVFSALNYWNTRTRHFGRLSTARVSAQAAYTGGTLGLGAAGHATSGAMIGASVAGQVLATSVLGVQIWRDGKGFFRSNISWRAITEGLGRYKRFPLMSSWSGVLNAVSWQLPVLLLGVFFSPTVVGFYALGMRLLQLPMNLIGGAVGQVFLQRASEAHQSGTLEPLVEALWRRLVQFALLPMLVVTITGRDLYIVIFGERWAEAGVYTQVLAIWAFFWFVSSPLSKLLIVLERQDFVLKFDLILLVSRVVALFVGGMQGSVLLALFLFASSGVIIYAYYGFKILQFSGVPVTKGFNVIRASFVSFVPVGGILLVAVLLGGPHLLMVGLSVGALGWHGWRLSRGLRQ